MTDNPVDNSIKWISLIVAVILVGGLWLFADNIVKQIDRDYMQANKTFLETQDIKLKHNLKINNNLYGQENNGMLQ
jgi:hypothetical protein